MKNRKYYADGDPDGVQEPSSDSVPAVAEAPNPTAPAQAPVPVFPTAPERDAEDLAHMKDLAQGQIRPETYKDLFGKKDTLGKIGTMFGLLVSGAGSGLTHQPNALLDMMNKEIERDLEAQKQNKTNAQNFLSLSYQHELQKAQARAHLSGMNLNDANTKKVVAETAGLAAKNDAMNKMYASLYNSMSNTSKNNPQGQSILTGTILPAIAGKMQQNNAQTGAQTKLNMDLKLQNQGNHPQAENGIDLNRMQKMINMGKLAPELPGAIAPSDVPQVTREAHDISINRNLAKIYDDSFKKLANTAFAGALTPGKRQADIDALATRISHDTGVISLQQAQGILEGMFPSKGDLPSTIQEKYNKGMEHFAGMESGTTTLDRYGLKQPFPEYKFTAKGTEKQGPRGPKEGDRMVSKSGKPAIFKNGQWYPDSGGAMKTEDIAGERASD